MSEITFKGADLGLDPDVTVHWRYNPITGEARCLDPSSPYDRLVQAMAEGGKFTVEDVSHEFVRGTIAKRVTYGD